MAYFISIAGNMGVGKSTLSEKLATQLGWELRREPVAGNPYLADFYADMRRWAFHSQMFFLSHNVQEHLRIMRKSEPVVQDRCVYENTEIFARNLYQLGHISERDWQVLHTIYQTVASLLRPPDLIIYLWARPEILMERIRRRARDFEQKVSPAYVESLNMLYETWVNTIKQTQVMKVNTEQVNFPEDEKAVEAIASDIMRTLDLARQERLFVSQLPGTEAARRAIGWPS